MHTHSYLTARPRTVDQAKSEAATGFWSPRPANADAYYVAVAYGDETVTHVKCWRSEADALRSTLRSDFHRLELFGPEGVNEVYVRDARDVLVRQPTRQPRPARLACAHGWDESLWRPVPGSSGLIDRCARCGEERA